MTISRFTAADYDQVPVRSLRIDEFNGQEVISLVFYYPFQKDEVAGHVSLKQCHQQSPDYVIYLLLSPDSMPYLYSCSLNNHHNQ
ncbi:MAG: hypothetical protein ACXWWC_12415 [Chitinophagaceae bacterium]